MYTTYSIEKIASSYRTERQAEAERGRIARAFRRPKADSRPAADRLATASVFADLDLLDDAVALERDEATVSLVRAENTVSLTRPGLVRTALAEVLPVGAVHPTSPFPAPDPRLAAPAEHVHRSAQRSFLPPVVQVDERPAVPSHGNVINTNRPRLAPQPGGFQPTGLETTMAAA